LRELEFRAIKHKYIDDEDGEVTLSLKIPMSDKVQAFAVPPKTVLKIRITEDEGDCKTDENNSLSEPMEEGPDRKPKRKAKKP